jgi:hypothetical protein
MPCFAANWQGLGVADCFYWTIFPLAERPDNQADQRDNDGGLPAEI